MKYQLTRQEFVDKTEIELPLSKSILNRFLIIQKLSGQPILKESKDLPNDVNLMIRCLSTKNEELNVEDAGTVMRFGTALYSIIPGKKILRGSDRMHERPIGILVDTLKKMGAEIEYLQKDGFPPLKIEGSPLHGGHFKIPGNVSSQFISSVLLISPYCQGTVKIELTGKILSYPYIDMTLDVMGAMGIEFTVDRNIITIHPQSYSIQELKIEKDWSSAAFIYQYIALSKGKSAILKNMKFVSFQGDAACIELFGKLGVKTKEHRKGLLIRKKDIKLPEKLEIDFTDFPDLFQSFVMTCYGLGIKLKARGLDNLHLKESHRLKSMKINIEKLGGEAEFKEGQFWLKKCEKKASRAVLKAFDDHRLAMSLACVLPLFEKLNLDNVDVVNKSFPSFWTEMEKLGIRVVEIP